MHDGDLLPFVLAVCAYLRDVEVESGCLTLKWQRAPGAGFN